MRYATAVALGLSPLLAAALVEPADIVVMAASGTSGAGRTATTGLLATEVMGSLSAYKVGGTHQHIPEMEQTLTAAGGVAVTLSFTPILAPLPRGILAICTPRLSGGRRHHEMHEVVAALRRRAVGTSARRPWPRLGHVGSNSAQTRLRLIARRRAGA